MAQIGDCLGCTCTFTTGCKAEQWAAKRAEEPVREIKTRNTPPRGPRAPSAMRMVQAHLKAERLAARAARKATV